ncbi:hypothetical protein [Nocardioides sp. SYSU DS0663]|uniref:hypothetical protein n=1 Tax=Nocardioides sp. SYSU DS0663 TaxID=3416445 RepID=UPI003F4C2EC6
MSPFTKTLSTVLAALAVTTSTALVAQPTAAKPARTKTSTVLRDPLIQPFPSHSIWNTSLSRTPRWVPANVENPTTKTLALEEDLLVLAPKARLTNVYATTAGWDSTKTRCGSRTDTVLKAGVPIPTTFRTDPGYHGSTPNHSTAIVLPDGTVYETQPLHVCPDGTVVSQYASPKWQGTSIYTGATPENPGGGSHGGSYMSALGGTIRLGEWSPGKTQIPHVLKIELWAKKYLSSTANGYRWPAHRADAYYATEYGGKVPAVRQGSLLGLPRSFPVWNLASEPARILARTLKAYGAYVVDDTHRDTVTFPVEWSNRGRVATQFEQQWGFPIQGHAATATGAHKVFLTDMETIYRSLAVVDDNTATSVGGAGVFRMAAPVPPLDLSGQ